MGRFANFNTIFVLAIVAATYGFSVWAWGHPLGNIFPAMVVLTVYAGFALTRRRNPHA
jgi:hypothetical protein